MHYRLYHVKLYRQYRDNHIRFIYANNLPYKCVKNYCTLETYIEEI
jgi:hypothetical protein